MLHDLQSVWERHFKRQETSKGMRQLVHDSWERCIAYGLTPTYMPRQRPDPEKLGRSVEANSHLLRVAGPVVQTIHETMQGHPHLIALADSEGVVIRLLGDPLSVERGKDSNLFEGASWHERDCGCNGAGTALASGQPVVLIGPEHFMADYADWTCVGVPVRGPDQAIIGALDLSVPNEQINVHTWGWMLSVGRAIESELRAAGAERMAASHKVAHQFEHPLHSIRGTLDLLCMEGELLPSHVRLIREALSQSEWQTAALITDALARGSKAADPESRVALFLAALEHLTDGFIAASVRGVLLRANARAQEIFPGLELPPPLGEALAHLAGQPESAPTTLSLQGATGQVEAHLIPVAGIGAVAILHLSREARLKQLQQDLLSSVSHELRGPLGTLSALIEAFREGVIPQDAQRRFLDGIALSLSHLRDLISAVIELASHNPESGHPTLFALNLGQTLEELNREWAGRFAERQIRYEVELPDLWVRADPTLLRRSVVTLLENALRFTPPGEKVRLAAVVEQNRVRTTLSDTGPGIPAEDLPYVANPFYKVNQARTVTASSGFGLGLTICKQLVERMEGRLEIGSLPGEGAWFSIILQAAPQPAHT